MTLHYGDCREMMKKLTTGSVDLIVTSPPYPNMGMPYGDTFTEASYLEFSREWLTEAVRVLAENGSLWINVGWIAGQKGLRAPLTYLLWPIVAALDLHFQQEIVWVKPNRPSPSNIRFTTRSERWMWLTKAPRGHTFNLDAVRTPLSENQGKDVRNNPLGSNPTDIWDFAPVWGNSKDRPDHPCPFPLPMIERIILVATNPGQTVLDPFMGSGTTGVAALKHGREFVGIEKEPAYLATAANRLLAMDRQPVAEVVSFQPRKTKTLTPQERIIELLSDGQPRSVADIFKAMGGAFERKDGRTVAKSGTMSLGTAKNTLAALHEAGLVAASGEGRRHNPIQYVAKALALAA